MKNCYPQLFLEKFKYIVKEEKIKKYMSDDLEVYFIIPTIKKKRLINKHLTIMMMMNHLRKRITQLNCYDSKHKNNFGDDDSLEGKIYLVNF